MHDRFDHPAYATRTIHGAINLEDAETIVLAPLAQTLCVPLSGTLATYGDNGNPTHRNRDDGAIVFPSDHRSVTDTPGGCPDSVVLSAAYAASAVPIH